MIKNKYITTFHALCLITLAALAGFTLSACKNKSPKASDGAKRFELKGKVVSADKANHKVTIEHGEIKGYIGVVVEFDVGSVGNGRVIQDLVDDQRALRIGRQTVVNDRHTRRNVGQHISESIVALKDNLVRPGLDSLSGFLDVVFWGPVLKAAFHPNHCISKIRSLWGRQKAPIYGH